MAIAFGATGANTGGTTAISVAFPTSITAGQGLALWVASKYPGNGPQTPVGWQYAGQAVGGSGAAGVDSGNTNMTCFFKTADGTETGTQAVSLPGANFCRARMARYTNATGVWSVTYATGASSTPGLAISATAGSNPGIVGGDFVLVGFAANGDGFTNSLETLASTGAVISAGAERNDDSGSQGDDGGLLLAEFAITSGTGSTAPVFAATSSGTAGSAPAGAVLFVRLREVAAHTAGAGASSITFAATAASSSRFASAGGGAMFHNVMRRDCMRHSLMTNNRSVL